MTSLLIRTWQVGASLSAAAVVLALAGCAQVGGEGAQGAGRDRVTASDETQDGRRARVRLELAAAYYGRGQLTTALDEVKLSIAADPTLVAAFNLRGLIYASLGDNTLAEESYRHALRMNARDADTLQNYGWYLCQRQRFDEADALFIRALAVPQYQDVARTLLSQGVCYAQAGRLDVAEATLQRAYEMDASNLATAFNLADVLYKRGQYDRARFFVRRVNVQPDVANAQTLWLAVRIENRLGNDQGVRALGMQLRNRFPQSPETLAYDQGKFE